MAPEVAAIHKAAFKNFTDEQQRSAEYWGKLGRGKQAENILEMVAVSAVAFEKEHGTITFIVNDDGSSCGTCNAARCSCIAAPACYSSHPAH